MNFIFCFLLFFLVWFADANQELNHNQNEFLHSKRTHFLNALNIMHSGLNKTFIDLFPEFKKKLAKVYSSHKVHLRECYDHTIVKNENAHVFENTIHDVVQKYFQHNWFYLENLNLKQTIKRIETFIGSVKTLARLLINCVLNRSKEELQTRLGLTSMSGFNQEEFEKLVFNRKIMNRPHLNLNSSNVLRIKRHLQCCPRANNRCVKNNRRCTCNCVRNAPRHNSRTPVRHNPRQPGRPAHKSSSMPCLYPCSLPPPYTRKLPSKLEDTCSREALPSDQPIPKSFNWAEKGYVSSAKSQSGCTACYAFAATAALESQHMIATQTRKSTHFSEMASINCVSNGCSGGQMFNVDDIFVSKGALKAEKLPYGRRQSCKTFTPDVKADHNCYHSSLSEEEMQRLVFRNGPGGVSMSISSKGPSYMYLKGSPAIFTANGCSMNTCHCVLLVGWEPGYWLLKNSFGKNWGLNGFFRLPKGGSNVNKCNILNEYSSSIILSK